MAPSSSPNGQGGSLPIGPAYEHYGDVRNRTSLHPHRLDELHSALMKLIINGKGANPIPMQDFIDAIRPFEIEKPVGS